MSRITLTWQKGRGKRLICDVRWRGPSIQGEGYDVAQHTLRVHLVDDDYLVRLGVERLFEGLEHIELESVSSTGDTAIREALALSPEVVLMETTVRNVDAVQAVREITTRAPQVKVAMLSSATDFGTMSDAYRAGAASYLSKYSVSSDLGAALRMIHRGDAIFSMPPDLPRFPLPAMPEESSEVKLIKRLPTRDRAILSALIAGRTNSQIAGALHVSEATVKAQITKIMAKLNVGGRVQLAVLAVKAGVATS